MNTRSKIAAFALLSVAIGTTQADSPVLMNFSIANFSDPLTIDNPFSPLAVGRHITYYEVEGNRCSIEDFVVTSTVKSDFRGKYAGIRVRDISDKSWWDKGCRGHRDVILEKTHDWFAQDNAGNVWYFGEDTTAYNYSNVGRLISTSTLGSWKAGKNGAQAGVVMLAQPSVGQFYLQESAPDVAFDAARVLQVNIPVSIGLGDFGGCLETEETSVLEPDVIEHKFYCPGVGLVLVDATDGGAEAIDLGLP